MADVIVIGGGIVGAYSAYLMSRQGVSCVLVERAGIGSQASSANPGGINPLHGPGLPGPLSPLAERAFALHLAHVEDIQRLAGMDVGFQRIKRVELAFDEQERTALQRSVASYSSIAGFTARFLERAELLALDPRINPEVVGGLWTEGNGNVNSRAYTTAIARAARALGAKMIAGEVTGVESQAGRVTGVRIGADVHACSAVVVATGAAVQEPERFFGVSLPVTPIKGELLLAELPEPQLEHHVSWKAIGMYRTEALCWLGGTQESVGFDTTPTEAGRTQILDAVARMVPDVRGAKIVDHIAGLRPVTPDALPLLGRMPGWDNAFVATGCGTKGMLLSAGMGECIADLVRGTQPKVPLKPYRPERFAT